MLRSLLFFGVTLFVCATVGQENEICIPQKIEDLTATNFTLSWSAPNSETCPIDTYYIFIYRNQTVAYIYDTTELSLDLNFLDKCVNYNFSVAADSNHSLGPESIVSGALSVLTNLTYESYTLDEYNVTTTEKHVVLTWDVEDAEEKCVTSYRVIVWDRDGAEVLDQYVEDTTYEVTNDLKMIPCMIYQIGARAIYFGTNMGPESMIRYVAYKAVSAPPTITSIYQGSTSINISWVFEDYHSNRCGITGVNIECPERFNMTFPYKDTTDHPRSTIFTNLTGLEPNTLYLSYVTVTNVFGVSSPLTIALQTLPSE